MISNCSVTGNCLLLETTTIIGNSSSTTAMPPTLTTLTELSTKYLESNLTKTSLSNTIDLTLQDTTESLAMTSDTTS